MVSRSSKVPNLETGAVKEYEANILQVGMAIHKDPAEFKAIDEEFRKIKDLSGRSMSEIAKEYWDNPEKQRKEIEELKRKHRGR